MKLEIFDVEHGACALLTAGTNHMLIDCGHNATTGWTPGLHLQGLGVNALDLLAITNYDEDHVSGLIDLERRVTVQRYLRNKSVDGPTLRALKSETGIGRNMDRLAEVIDGLGRIPGQVGFPDVSYEVYYNSYPEFDDENNLSMVLVLGIQGVVFIFPGDLECAGWESLLASSAGFRAAVQTANVLVASHHGRESGICDKLFNQYRCAPQLIVISDDYHQYDTQKTLGYYGSKARGIVFRGEQRKVLTTRRDKTITFVWSALSGAVCY